ncbi:DUF5983 family protein [Ewingella americana]|uniref:DUF5983 family protein n=1 Tax=Ewingella americana TaxID=41202 RepID=UPI001639B5BB|nr:DUF5983 family protein [Ewingella americana]QMV54167.1 hypothetical protein GXP68_23105 [Ewingella americana]
MEKIRGIKCSTFHISKDDAEIFCECSRREGYWLHDTHYGYLLVLSGYKYPCLKLKGLGISKSVRKLVFRLMREQGVEILLFDRDADTLEGFETFAW